MRNQLIPIQERDGQKAVSARELYDFLEVGERLGEWIKRMFSYGFVKDIDYQAVTVFVQHPNGVGGTKKKDYALTIDTAKEISMLQRSEKGKQARRYFIECEKIARQTPQLPDFNNPVAAARAWADEVEQKRVAERQAAAAIEQSRIQAEVIKVAKPKIDYHDEVLRSTNTYTTSQIANELGMSAISLNRKLQAKQVQYKQRKQWLIRSKYAGKGYTKTDTYTFVKESGEIGTRMTTVWTEKGRQFIHGLVKANA